MIYKLLINAITLSRIILSIVFTYMILRSPQNIIGMTALFFLIGISDLIDGKLARRFSATSKAGAIIDVFADLFFIISASIGLIVRGVFPVWMLVVMVGKFLEFWCTSSYARKCRNYDSNIFLFDSLGRKVVVLFYLIPYITVLFAFFIPQKQSFLIISIGCIPIMLGAVLSSLRRMKACFGSNTALLKI